MKKIIAILMCAMMVFALPVVAFAEEVEEGEAPTVEATEEPDYSIEIESGDVVVNSNLAGYLEYLEAEKKAAEDAAKEETAEDEPYEKPEAQIEAELTTQKIVEYVKAHLEEISVIVTMILTVFYQIRKHAVLNKSIGTLNNNAVSVAENSAAVIGQAMSGMEGMSSTVGNYANAVERVLDAYRSIAEDKQELKATIAEVKANLATSKAANIEFANELAELLVLANIPNSKKDELYSRHRAAVDAIDKIAVQTAEQTEVKEDVGEKA